MDRKGFFTDGLKQLLGGFLQSPVGQTIDARMNGLSNMLAPEGLDHLVEKAAYHDPLASEYVRARNLPRPPGAASPRRFHEVCTRCGDCIQACSPGALFSQDSVSGPVADPNAVPCLLCDDFPCISACETGALLPLSEDTLPKFGQAVLIPENCLNQAEHRARRKQEGAARLNYCRECLKTCPVEGAVEFDGEKMPIFADYCTGCGICAQNCPPVPRAIRIEW